jgi:putative two-component system response regulator
LFLAGMFAGLLLCLAGLAIARFHWRDPNLVEVLMIGLALVGAALWTLNSLRLSLANSKCQAETNRRLAAENKRLEDRQKSSEELIQTQDLAIIALAKVAETRDDDTGQHLFRIREYCRILGEELRNSGHYQAQLTDQFLDDLYRSSPLHDIGKVGIRDRILLKPLPLSTNETEVMKTHAILGADILEQVMRDSKVGGFLSLARDIARSHHEWWDGSGYPDGLVGSAIPLAARLVAVADVFDALTSRRPYKNAVLPSIAKQRILRESGSHFDPAVAEALVSGFSRLVHIWQSHRDEHLIDEIDVDHIPVASIAESGSTDREPFTVAT